MYVCMYVYISLFRWMFDDDIVSFTEGPQAAQQKLSAKGFSYLITESLKISTFYSFL